MATDGQDDETHTGFVPPIGAQVGHYQVLRKIGVGGMGEVYQAQDTALDRRVALKFLHSQYAADEDFRARFVREAQAAAKLSHPNIVHVYDVSAALGRPYFAMEFVEGRSLRAALDEEQFTPDAVVDIVSQVCDGLREAHEAGVVHRDIKPSNIILDHKDRPKLVDFGLATIKGRERLTKTGSTFGTFGYMSPEHVEGVEVDPRSDLFSVGVVLYEMLAGKAPFARPTQAATINAILHGTPEPLSRHRPDLPQELQRIVSKLLARDRDERYQTAAEVRDDLSSLRARRGAPAEGSSPPSIAVLPFVDMSRERDQEYFCEGMAEELIDGLAKLDGLRVVSRTAAFQFKGKGQDVAAIGRRLKVQTVLEGSVRKAGKRIRVTAQLVNASDGYHLWSDKYDRDLEDIFSIQDEIALAIVDKLKIRLLGGEEARLVKRFTDDEEAHNLFLKGRYFWNKRYEVGLKKSIEYFQRAMEKDPEYALPYVGVADAYNILGNFGFVPPTEASAKARAAASKALEIDGSLGEAYASLGWVSTFCDWDWEAAERHFERAIGLSPRYATARQWHALQLAVVKRHEEALREAELAVALDPLSLIINTVLGLVLYFAGRTDESIRQYNKVLEMEPGFQLATEWLALTYGEQGKYEQAVALAERAASAAEDMQYTIGLLAMAYAMAGREDAARETLERLTALARKRYVSPLQMALVHASLGELDRAVEFFEKAYDARDPLLPWIDHWSVFERMRGMPRFERVVRKIGLPSPASPTGGA